MDDMSGNTSTGLQITVPLSSKQQSHMMTSTPMAHSNEGHSLSSSPASTISCDSAPKSRQRLPSAKDKHFSRRNTVAAPTVDLAMSPFVTNLEPHIESDPVSIVRKGLLQRRIDRMNVEIAELEQGLANLPLGHGMEALEIREELKILIFLRSKLFVMLFS